jgi:ATP-dependent RNA helicase SUPV3L1/SUV3
MEPKLRSSIETRLNDWLSQLVRTRLSPLVRLTHSARAPDIAPTLRGILVQLTEQGGVLDRSGVDEVLAGLERKDRHALQQMGVTIGTLDLFMPPLLKPEPTRLRLALITARRAQTMPPLPLPGLGLLDRPSAELARAAQSAGFRRFGDQMLRIDLVEKIARTAHDLRGSARTATVDPALATSLGVGAATYGRIMRALGFMPEGDAHPHKWRWRGRPRRAAVQPPTNGAFAVLGQLKR